jgi:hypothetical protein
MAQFPDIIAVTCSKKENCAQKQQIIIAWLGIGKKYCFYIILLGKHSV